MSVFEGDELLEHFTARKKPIIIDGQIVDWEEGKDDGPLLDGDPTDDDDDESDDD